MKLQWHVSFGIRTLTATFGTIFLLTNLVLVISAQAPEQFIFPWSSGDWFFTGGPHGWGSATAPGSGLDFATKPDTQEGRTVTAMLDGKVTDMGRFSNGANYIKVQSMGGWEIWYLHLEKPAKNLRVNDTVKQGQPIGSEGSTGAPALHLHVELRHNGQPVSWDNPGIQIDGWTVHETSNYNGFLEKGDKRIVAAEYPTTAQLMMKQENLPPPDFGISKGKDESAKPNSTLLDQITQGIQGALRQLIPQIHAAESSPEPPRPMNRPPDQFHLISPFGNSQFSNGTLPTLQWQSTSDPDADPVEYKVIIDNANSLDARLPGEVNHVESDWLSGTNWRPVGQGLETGGRYTWYVIAQDNRGGQTGSIDHWTFTIASLPPCDKGANRPPDQFSLVSPADKSQFSARSLPTFQWQSTSDPNCDPIRYKVVIDNATTPDKRSEGEPGLVMSNWLSTTSWTPPIGMGLEMGGRYTWYVIADDGREGQTGGKDHWSFVILTKVSSSVPSDFQDLINRANLAYGQALRNLDSRGLEGYLAGEQLQQSLKRIDDLKGQRQYVVVRPGKLDFNSLVEVDATYTLVRVSRVWVEQIFVSGGDWITWWNCDMVQTYRLEKLGNRWLITKIYPDCGVR